MSQTLIPVIIIAIVSAFGYDVLRSQLPNPLVVVAIGIVLAFIGRGGLVTLVGSALASIGVADYVARFVETVSE